MTHFAALQGGPVHAELPRGAWGQAWCGVRRQFRHRTTTDAVTCPRCLRALGQGRPYSRKGR